MARNEFTCDCTVVHEDVVAQIRAEMCPESKANSLSDFFRTVGDPTRMKILLALDCHELCVCDLANVLGMTKSAVSHQLAVLRKAALVTFRRAGKTVYYSPADDHVRLLLETGMEHIEESSVFTDTKGI